MQTTQWIEANTHLVLMTENGRGTVGGNSDHQFGAGQRACKTPVGMSNIRWTFFPGQTRIPEYMAPKFVSGFSSRAAIEAIDLGAPVALDYHALAPFAFNGKIEKLQFYYLG